jgi:rfaE bifunctional protein nucleotidyltransferase chain/domain
MMDGEERNRAAAHESTRNARDKVRSIDELGLISQQARAAGETVVLAHGVFDLVHLGHVRHLEAARREGTVLIVTITCDKHVGKGPGRPVFPEQLRAEMLAALEYVDWVGINHGSSAEPVIHALEPHVYVKGSEYENPDEDVTGRIIAEREAVEAHGGRLCFTRDVTFSSSKLINRYLDIYDPLLRDHLEAVRSKGGLDTIIELIERVRNFRVLLIGDAIIDEYQYIRPLGKSSKENMIATLSIGHEAFAGGVFAAANHVAGLCREVEVVTCLGRENDGEDLIRDSVRSNVKLNLLYRDGVPTTRKCRFIEPGYMRKLFEVYSMDDEPLGSSLVSDLDQIIGERANEFDLVIVTDFGHGLIGPSTVKTLINSSRFLAVNAQSNSANMGYNLITKYPRADYVSIDAPEARMAAADKFGDLATLASDQLHSRIECGHIILTHGSNGCVTWKNGETPTRIPAFTKTVVDTVGAGDAFFAVTSPLVAAGGAMDLVGFVGNAAGAIKVGIVGHRQSIEKAPLIKYITALLK